jgi:hypothetical protein
VDAEQAWTDLRHQLQLVRDVITFPWITILSPAKDRPVLYTAAAWADVLLTLDRRDFLGLIGSEFFDLSIRTPGQFLFNERDAGRYP